MDKQRNQLIKAYTRSRKQVNQNHRFYEVNYALEHPEFDVIDFEKFKQPDKKANFIAKNPKLIEKFSLKDMTTDHVKVILSYQPQLHPYFKNIMPHLLYSAISYILDRQIGPEEFRRKLHYINSVGVENIINILGSYDIFNNNISMGQMVNLLVKYPEIYDTVKKYFNMKYIDGPLLFDLLNEVPELFEKEELNVNTIKPEEFEHLLKFYPQLKDHPKAINYKYEKPMF